MTQTPEEIPAHVLTVDPDASWRFALRKRLTARNIAFGEAKTFEDGVERLNSGDFTAVITDGFKGRWRDMVEEARQRGIRPIVLSSSTMVTHAAETEGIAAFHKARSQTKEGIDPIIRAATAPEALVQQAPTGPGTATPVETE